MPGYDLRLQDVSRYGPFLVGLVAMVAVATLGVLLSAAQASERRLLLRIGVRWSTRFGLSLLQIVTWALPAALSAYLCSAFTLSALVQDIDLVFLSSIRSAVALLAGVGCGAVAAAQLAARSPFTSPQAVTVCPTQEGLEGRAAAGVLTSES